MRSDRDEKSSARKGDLLVILATINNHMALIRKSLESNPAVSAVTRGCDVRRYHDLILEEEVNCFETHVEATIHTGNIFCWSLDINLTSQGWKFQRHVAKQTSDGEQQEIGFEDLTFEDFDDLANSCVSLMIEFTESARNFGLPV
jgi:putative heme degradation protein